MKNFFITVLLVFLLPRAFSDSFAQAKNGKKQEYNFSFLSKKIQSWVDKHFNP
jgi:hypothetical protein